jgi:transcriptional regulator with GAF, ATPase, and Fis domain
MENAPVSFEQILNATLRLLRTTWKAKVCLFLQMDDHGNLRVRAADGIPFEKASAISVKPSEGSFDQCISKNKMVPAADAAALGALAKLLKFDSKTGDRFILSPVRGETRVLGVLVLGPFTAKTKNPPREVDLRSAGALCAVLSAQWRLYEWMSSYVLQLNHDLRTPLTAVQGSIGMVLGGMFGQVGTDVKEMLEMAQKGCERTVLAIEDYINQPKPTTKEPKQKSE